MGRRIRDWVVLKLFSIGIYQGNFGPQEKFSQLFSDICCPSDISVLLSTSQVFGKQPLHCSA